MILTRVLEKKWEISDLLFILNCILMIFSDIYILVGKNLYIIISIYTYI